MTKTITDPFWQRIDRLNALKTMIKNIAKIPRGYKETENFTANKEEDAAEFMIFLLDLHLWETFMSLHSIKQVLVGANKSIDYLQNVGEEPVVEQLINLTKSSVNQGKTVKFKEIIQDQILEPRSCDESY